MVKEFNTIDDFDVENKTVLVRIDINSPVDPGSGIILDDTRLKLHAQTIKELSNKGAKVVLLAHQSRPGKQDFTTLSQHADALSDILNLRVKYIDALFSNSWGFLRADRRIRLKKFCLAPGHDRRAKNQQKQCEECRQSHESSLNPQWMHHTEVTAVSSITFPFCGSMTAGLFNS